MEVHLRALWLLPHQNALPPAVSSGDLTKYAKRYGSEAEVRSSVKDYLAQNADNINDAPLQLVALEVLLKETSIRSKNIQRIPEKHRLLMFRTVACSGLDRWAPDVLGGDPESMYNLLHEHIALTTFEQVASAFGYSHMGINLSFITNFSLLHRLYRSFVFSYMFGLAKAEQRKPGSVAKGKEMTNVFKRRSDVSPSISDMKF